MTNASMTFSIAGTIAALCVIISPVDAQATDIDWNWDVHTRPVKAKKHYRKTYRREREDIRYYANPREYEITFEDDGNKRPVCVPEIIEAIGSEHTTADNSMEAARKQWEWTVEWKWGSQYMTLELAREFRSHCGKSDAMETVTGRINAAVNEAIGKDGFNQRCVIRARPCRASMERAEDRPR